jgi:hypothetical protein
MTTTERIVELQEYARQDGERCNEDSIADFLAFPQEIAGMDGPFLFLEDDGNLRAVWRNSNKRFGIEFLGEGKGRLVYKLGTFYGGGDFTLAGVPARLSPKSLLAFAKNNGYRESEEVARHALSNS